MNKAEQILFEYLKNKGQSLSKSELRDFGLRGDESEDKIIEFGNDYLSELHSERSENAQFKKCPQSINPIDY